MIRRSRSRRTTSRTAACTSRSGRPSREPKRLLEQQRHDTSLPLDDRWEEISGWLDLTAGQLRARLGVPDEVARDLQAAVGRRNRVAHDAWMLYSAAANRQESADTWVPWLHGEATMFMQVRRGLWCLAAHLRDARVGGCEVTDDAVLRVWRQYVPDPVQPRPDR